MKKFITIAFILLAISVCNAGDIRTLPQSIILTSPTTNKVEILDLTFVYGSTPYAVARYNVLDADGNVRASHSVEIRNIVDDPDTVEDETTTDFTSFVASIGPTLASRTDLIIWDHIKDNYDRQ